MSTLTVDGLTVAFGGIKALDEVSFHVEPGEVFAIIGPNGAGKSTIFNAISRIYTARAGSIRFHGREILELPPHEVVRLGIARTFQNIELFEKATVLQNLLVGRHSRVRRSAWREFLFLPGVRRGERAARRKVEEILDLLDMQHLRDALVCDLPYGARKNVELARALCAEPELLLLDEPASGLNPEETADMSFWLKDIKEELGVTIVMVEHDMNLVGRIANRVMALAGGRVLSVGSVEEVQSNERVQTAYLGAAA
ncbi:ABC transporter ATP-binding protein [Azospirillum sp. RWY-5-1]|uniref:ABC transporter ATP-binding protein n=1 Tax=Azospirillum oleiclasticum TaxID=2735135 RepID=A0ABX2TGB1_9PROT|nr:ABC transporter ATP-binding protein [Azospirillum oleiclasticum]NYZ15799.1 ABC transporter ATP-binding protein [Azospirillum oleiclasticum]NYZ22069.1 ABC transporter ATP-binding protein [Azospirillum oleiclasticum]